MVSSCKSWTTADPGTAGRDGAGERSALTGPCCASVNGFSWHANTQIPAPRHYQWEHLIRYTARGAVSLEQLAEEAHGDLVDMCTRPWADARPSPMLSRWSRPRDTLLQAASAKQPQCAGGAARAGGKAWPPAGRRGRGGDTNMPFVLPSRDRHGLLATSIAFRPARRLPAAPARGAAEARRLWRTSTRPGGSP
jgi:hypothetical protein